MKFENSRTLCNYYNEIVSKVEQLTEMCGNTKEAINLRDDIYDMFTVKFSQPLDDIAELQEELGCPLDVLFRALKDGIYHDEEFEHPILILDKDNFELEQMIEFISHNIANIQKLADEVRKKVLKEMVRKWKKENKMNKLKGCFSHITDDWRTPKDIYNYFNNFKNQEYGIFEIKK